MNKKQGRNVNQPGGGEIKVSDKWPKAIKGIFLTLLAFTLTVVFAGCGEMSSSTVPIPPAVTPTLSLEAYGPRGSTTEGSDNMIIRANGRDLLEVVATVTGLIREVGFYMPVSYGTWVGGSTHADDMFQYYVVDDNGKARAVLTAGASAGRQEIVARYLTVQLGSWVVGSYIETRLLITFDFATLTIFPNVIVLNGDASKARVVEVRGALPPVEWWVSHVDVIGFHIRDAMSIYIYWKDPLLPIASAALPSGGGTLYVLDAEGQTATAQVFMINQGCDAGLITISPSFGDAAAAPVMISITVTDNDLLGVATVTVFASGGSTLGGGTSAVLPSTTPGIFSGTFSFAAPADGVYTIIYQDANDPGNSCLSNTVEAIFTATP